MRFLLALGLLLPAPISAQDWNMGVEKRLNDLERRVEALEKLSWNQGYKECTCSKGGKCICDPDNCKCVDCPEHLTSDRAIEIYAANEEEIRKIWESGDDGRTLKDAVKIWLRQQKEKKSKQDVPSGLENQDDGIPFYGVSWKGTKPTNNGREVLYFGADWCANCPSAISRLGELTNQIYYIDCTNDDTLAAMYRVDSYPSLIAIEDGVKVPGAHTEGDSVGSFLASKFLLKETPSASSKTSKAIVRLEPSKIRKTSARASYEPSRASTGYRVIPVPSPTIARASVNRYPGPNWTWPGSLRTHLETAHGFSTAGFSEGELRTIHDNFHNTGSSGVVGARYSTPAPITRTQTRNYSPPRQSFPVRVMSSFGSFCPSCPR